MSQTKEALRVHVRWMIRRDLPEVMEIEGAIFAYAWSEEEFLRCLRQRNCIGMVAEHGEKVVGFLIQLYHANRLDLLNLAVHPHYRRAGVARQLIARVLGNGAFVRRGTMTADVGEANLDAQLFFRALGFRCSHIRRGYYADSGEDAYRFVYRVAGGAKDASAG